MEISIFAPLDGATPWLWLTLALALGAVELVATSFFLIWVALAALGVAGALAVMPGLGGTSQAVIFAALSVGFTFAGRTYLKRRKGRKAPGPVLNRRAEALIGRRVKVVQAFDSGLGGVEIDGALWRARLTPGTHGGPAPVEGDSLVIRSVDGAVLQVSAA